MEQGDTCHVTNSSTGKSEDKSYDQMKQEQGPKKPWGIALIVFGAVVVVVVFIRAIRNRPFLT
jgi:steroid 5-alpha reductase family enzyme